VVPKKIVDRRAAATGSHSNVRVTSAAQIGAFISPEKRRGLLRQEREGSSRLKKLMMAGVVESVRRSTRWDNIIA